MTIECEEDTIKAQFIVSFQNDISLGKVSPLSTVICFTPSGLGLSIVKHAVMIHNGKIEVKSELGEGTEMIVTIPNKQDINL